MKRLSERWLWFCYKVLYLPVVWLAILLFSTRTRGRLHVPRSGPFLAIANHESFLDPILIALAVVRPTYFLARRTLFEPRWFGWLISALGAIPLEREQSGTEGLKAGLDVLKAGSGLILFPEGTRTRDGRLQPFKRGVLLLLRRSRAPILPVAVAGPYHAMPRGSFLPRLCPLFLPATAAGLACVVGPAIPYEKVEHLSNDELIRFLEARVAAVRAQAEALRRKPTRR
ncbi:MAG: 1-acyl-sn-glycerol-3-phosphate acyltransferase [Gemmatales bacterium]|nr:1-acyl-sn-glycerol-3-phosphate acyltransferase [Gemmatales bacterium]MDW8388007.1 lysophospholipid acyltransferase family protein [Gemmatales bacterium]